MDRVAAAVYTGATPIFIGWPGWPMHSMQETSRSLWDGWGGQVHLYRMDRVAKPRSMGWIGWPMQYIQEPSRSIQGG